MLVRLVKLWSQPARSLRSLCWGRARKRSGTASKGAHWGSLQETAISVHPRRFLLSRCQSQQLHGNLKIASKDGTAPRKAHPESQARWAPGGFEFKASLYQGPSHMRLYLCESQKLSSTTGNHTAATQSHQEGTGLDVWTKHQDAFCMRECELCFSQWDWHTISNTKQEAHG